ncbi:MAG: BrnT family toxin [Desulfobacterales bacterium]
MRIVDFEWDEGNSLHIQLGHGIEPEEVEEVFANKPFYRKTTKGHYAAFGPTLDGRYLTIIFELRPKGIARPITGWDMSRAELRNYKKTQEIKNEQTDYEIKKLDQVL